MNTITTSTHKFVVALVLLTGSIALSKDLGFRFKNGKCVNEQQKTGLNPGFFGQCADLKGLVIGRFNLDEYDFSGSDFTGADLQKSTLNKTILEKVNFESANLAGVQFSEAKMKNSNFTKANLKNSRLSEAEAENCDFSKVDFSGIDLSYFKSKGSIFAESKFTKSDLSGADLTKSNFNKADFTEAKLEGTNLSQSSALEAIFKKANLIGANFSEAKLNSSIFKNGNLENVIAKGADLSGADFRSADMTNLKLELATMKKAMFNRKTILPVTKEKAEELGMVFANSGNVLIVWDNKTEELKQLQNALLDQGMEVTYSKKVENEFDGTELKGDFDSVIHLNGDTYNQAMPEAGQKALIEFVKNGGTFIHSELNGYETDNGGMSGMIELSLFPYDGRSGKFEFSAVTGKSAHPLLEGIPSSIKLNAPISPSNTKIRNFTDGKTEVVMRSQNADVVAFRKLGQGTVVGFSFSCTYTGTMIPSCLAEKTVQRLYINAINFGVD